MAENRPRLKLSLTAADQLVTFLCLGGLAAVWFWTFYLHRTLPDTIPVHYNLAGEADRFGSKTSIFFIPGISTLLVFGLLTLTKYPHTFNYPVEITPFNAERNFRLATRVLRYLALALPVLAGSMLHFDSREAGQAGIGPWPFVMCLAIGVLLPFLLFFIFRRKVAG